MISAALICKDCGFMLQGIIILTVLAEFFVNTEPANKTFQNSVGTDQYTLIEQSDDFTN